MNPSLVSKTVSGTFHSCFAHEYQRMKSLTAGTWMNFYDLDVPYWPSESLLSMADRGVQRSRPPEKTSISLMYAAPQTNSENSGKDQYSGTLVSRAAPTNDGCVPQQTLTVSCWPLHDGDFSLLRS